MSGDRENLLNEDYRKALKELGDELTKESWQSLLFLFHKIPRSKAASLESQEPPAIFHALEEKGYLSLTNVDVLTKALWDITHIKGARILESYKRRNENWINAELQRQLEGNQRRTSDSSNSSSVCNSLVTVTGNVQNEAKKKIFISFSFRILERATALKDRIEKSIGKDSCWICTTEIRGGDTMYRKITQAIDDADILLCMINQDFVNSTECEREVLLSSSKDKEIIPILLEKVDLRNLKKQNGEPSPMQLPLAQLLYINMYDQAKDKDEFEKLIKTIQEKLLLIEQGAGGDCQGQSNPVNAEGEARQCENSSPAGEKRCHKGDPCNSSLKKTKTE